jgi:hypothetical protein
MQKARRCWITFSEMLEDNVSVDRVVLIAIALLIAVVIWAR